jgi:hypothetical protein
MDDALNLKEKLIGLEERYWHALKEGDLDTVLALTDDRCIVAGAQGVADLDKQAFAGMMKDPEWTIRKFKIRDAVVEQLSDDVAIIAYKVREDLTVDGKSITLDAADASTWVRKNGEWVCALHTESISGDPYGRDRKNLAM